MSGPAQIPGNRPLVVVDVDEVLALFFQGFGRFVARHGYELRCDRFALFSNIFAPGAAQHLEIAAGRALFDEFFRTGADLMDPAPGGTEHLEIAAGRALFDEFFRTGAELMDPAPGAAQALALLSRTAEVMILTNAPGHGRDERARWLVRHGMDYPLHFNEGPKGPAIARLAMRTRGPVVFVDDLVQHLDSCAEAAPHVRRFQTVADEALRPLAPSNPNHRRIDGWDDLARAIEAVILPA